MDDLKFKVFIRKEFAAIFFKGVFFSIISFYLPSLINSSIGLLAINILIFLEIVNMILKPSSFASYLLLFFLGYAFGIIFASFNYLNLISFNVDILNDSLFVFIFQNISDLILISLKRFFSYVLICIIGGFCISKIIHFWANKLVRYSATKCYKLFKSTFYSIRKYLIYNRGFYLLAIQTLLGIPLINIMSLMGFIIYLLKRSEVVKRYIEKIKNINHVFLHSRKFILAVSLLFVNSLAKYLRDYINRLKSQVKLQLDVPVPKTLIFNYQ